MQEGVSDIYGATKAGENSAPSTPRAKFKDNFHRLKTGWNWSKFFLSKRIPIWICTNLQTSNLKLHSSSNLFVNHHDLHQHRRAMRLFLEEGPSGSQLLVGRPSGLLDFPLRACGIQTVWPMQIWSKPPCPPLCMNIRCMNLWCMYPRCSHDVMTSSIYSHDTCIRDDDDDEFFYGVCINDACVHIACIHHSWIHDTCIQDAHIHDSMMLVPMMHVYRMHVSMICVSMMHVSMMLVSIFTHPMSWQIQTQNKSQVGQSTTLPQLSLKITKTWSKYNSSNINIVENSTNRKNLFLTLYSFLSRHVFETAQKIRC